MRPFSSGTADIFIPHWAGANDAAAALDVTVIDSLQEAQIQGAAATPALDAAHKRKLDQSWEASKSAIAQVNKLGVHLLTRVAMMKE